jgi:succinyl-diaminopimelate desuccinylase
VTVVDLLARLVAAGSENPPGDERAVAAITAEALGDGGLEARTVFGHEHRPNVVGTLARGPGPRLVLQAHMDTKPRGDAADATWDHDPLTLTERDGLLFGLGACDAKGALAAMLSAAARLAAHGHWSGTLEVHGAADEEDGSQHGAALAHRLGLTRADAAIVGEPTGCRRSSAQLGNAWARVLMTGRAAHAGTPAAGRDAVWAAHAFMSAVRARLAGLPADPRFPGHPRLNVGSIRGGLLPGTLPGSCELLCDIRVLPGQRRGDLHRIYRDAARRVAAEAGVDCSVEPFQGGGCEAHQIAPGSRIESAFLAAAGRLGAGPEPEYFLGGSDARFYARAGTPTLVFGPGDLRVAHAPNEYVPRADLERAVDLLEHTALAFFAAAPETPPGAGDR